MLQNLMLMDLKQTLDNECFTQNLSKQQLKSKTFCNLLTPCTIPSNSSLFKSIDLSVVRLIELRASVDGLGEVE